MKVSQYRVWVGDDLFYRENNRWWREFCPIDGELVQLLYGI